MKAVDRLGIGDDLDGALREIGGDAGLLLRSSQAEQAKPGNERDTRQRIERPLDSSDAGILAREIILITLDESRHRDARRAFEIVQSVAFRRGRHERPILGADRVVGSDHARLAIARELAAVDEIEDGGRGAEIENRAAPRAFDVFDLAAAGAAQNRRHGRNRRDRLGQVRRHEHRLAVLLQSLLSQCDQRDHALIGLARAAAEGDDAVLVQDQALDRGLGVVDLGCRLGEEKSGPHVRHHARAAVVEFAADHLTVRLVDDA